MVQRWLQSTNRRLMSFAGDCSQVASCRRWTPLFLPANPKSAMTYHCSILENQRRATASRRSVATAIVISVVAFAIGDLTVAAESSETNAGGQCCVNTQADHRIWLISTRHLTCNVRCCDLSNPDLRVSRLSSEGETSESSMEEYLRSISKSGATVLYTHGNRMQPHQAIFRGLAVSQHALPRVAGGPVDWVIWSWASEKEGFLTNDVRIKAERTDAQGLYMGWLLRRHAEVGVSTAMIGYSFGGRVVTGALHAAGGGMLSGRKLPEAALQNLQINAGLVAPAIDSNWMTETGYHSIATKNLNRLTLLYNHRDAVLKRYWLISKVRGQSALGYTGPTRFGRRFDGTRLPVRARDCSSTVGLHHSEIDYYQKACRAGSEMASLINDLPSR